MIGYEVLPWVTTVAAVCYGIYITCKTSSCCKKRVNNQVDLDNNKVVHCYDIEDLDDKTAFCRCWKSKKFPYCDGAHNEHNEKTGDNLGPVIVQKKK